MTDEDALLAAIREAPDDPMPWSVYADWLQARGDSNGELIALQLEKPRCIDRARLAEIEARIEVIHRRDGGIDGSITIDAAFDATFAARLRKQPIRFLGIANDQLSEEQLALLVDTVGVLPLHTLFAGTIPPAHLRRLLQACPQLAGVGIINRGSSAHAVATGETLRRLTWFDAGYSSTVDDEGLAALATIPTLKRLRIPRAQVTAAGAGLLARLPVEDLELGANEIGDRGIAPLCDATTLRELAIEGTGFTSATVERIAGSPALSGLRRLSLGSSVGRSNLTPRDLQTLIDSPHLPRDLVLRLDGYALGLVPGYRDDDFAPEFNGPIWETKPTGPITERFRVEVGGDP